MFPKVTLLLLMYRTFNLVAVALGAPTHNAAFSNISNSENLNGEAESIPRIVTGFNGTNADRLLTELSEYTDASRSQNIIFPDAFLLLYKRNLQSAITPQCATINEHFCEDYEKYPHSYLNYVLPRTKKHSEFFGTDEEPIEITNRLGEPEETFICPSSVKTIFPKIGKNKEDKWKYIINQGDDEGVHVQGIRVETCTKLNEPCNLLSDIPLGYVTSCKQKFVLRRLLSVTENGQPVPDTFQIPSACCCSFRKDVTLLAKSSSDSSTNRRRRKLL